MNHERARSILQILPMQVTRVIFSQVVLLGLCVLVRAQETPEIHQLRTRAQQGYVEDQLKLAHSLQLGVGVQRDVTESARWLLKAASLGDSSAQSEVAYLYAKGEGVPQDD